MRIHGTGAATPMIELSGGGNFPGLSWTEGVTGGKPLKAGGRRQSGIRLGWAWCGGAGSTIFVSFVSSWWKDFGVCAGRIHALDDFRAFHASEALLHALAPPFDRQASGPNPGGHLIA